MKYNWLLQNLGSRWWMVPNPSSTRNYVVNAIVNEFAHFLIFFNTLLESIFRFEGKNWWSLDSAKNSTISRHFYLARRLGAIVISITHSSTPISPLHLWYSKALNLSISACGCNAFDTLSTIYVFFELLTELFFPLPITWIIPVSEYLSLNWGIEQISPSIHFKWSLDLINWQPNFNILDGHNFNNHTFCCFLRINWRTW